MGRQKNDHPKWTPKSPPRHSRKTLVFLTYFAVFALRDPFGGRFRHALHFQNEQKSIDFTTSRTPHLDPTQGTKGNIQNYKHWAWDQPRYKNIAKSCILKRFQRKHAKTIAFIVFLIVNISRNGLFLEVLRSRSYIYIYLYTYDYDVETETHQTVLQ